MKSTMVPHTNQLAKYTKIPHISTYHVEISKVLANVSKHSWGFPVPLLVGRSQGSANT